MTKITFKQYRDAVSDNKGWCTWCEAFTRESGVEPDAHEYTCDDCTNPTVYGAEEALLMGFITV